MVWRKKVVRILAPMLLVACGNDTGQTVGREQQGKTAANSFVSIKEGAQPSVWWVRAEYHPFETSVRGLPVAEIDVNWCKASEFRRELFPPELLKMDGEDILEKPGNAFALRGKFDGANEHLALVGVYETCKQQRGTFLLILDETKSGKARVVTVHQFAEYFQFPSLSLTRDHNVELWWCFRCDNYQELYWDKSKSQYGWRDDAYYYGLDAEDKTAEQSKK